MLSIEESYSYQALNQVPFIQYSQKINLIEIADGDGAVQYIQLKKPVRCFLKVEVTEPQVDQKYEVPVTEVEVSIFS